MGTHIVSHPAVFNKAVLVECAKMLAKYCDGRTVLDPLGGVGGAFDLEALGYEVTCLEIEREWIGQHPRHIWTDAIEWTKLNATMGFDAIVVSPPYGNRMADHHNARDDSKRITYKAALGRDLHPSNSAGLQWGDAYRKFFLELWGLCRWQLKEGGVFVLNVKDHVRKGEVVPVGVWHADMLVDLGYEPLECKKVATRGMRYGENGEARVDGEYVYAFQWGER